MKKNLFLLPLFITSYFFSSAFLFKPNIKNIKMIRCGHIDVIKSDIESLKDYPWIFDYKSGQLYSYDHKKNSIKPVNREIVEIDDGFYEYIYVKNYVKRGKLYVEQIDRDLETNEISEAEAILDFKNLKVSWFQDGEVTESVCKEIKLPKGLQILK